MDGRARYRDRSVLMRFLPPPPPHFVSPADNLHPPRALCISCLWSFAPRLAFPPRFIYIFSTPLLLALVVTFPPHLYKLVAFGFSSHPSKKL